MNWSNISILFAVSNNSKVMTESRFVLYICICHQSIITAVNNGTLYYHNFHHYMLIADLDLHRKITAHTHPRTIMKPHKYALFWCQANNQYNKLARTARTQPRWLSWKSWKFSHLCQQKSNTVVFSWSQPCNENYTDSQSSRMHYLNIDQS